MSDETQTESLAVASPDVPSQPGLVVVSAEGRVCWEPFMVGRDALVVGRDLFAGRRIQDSKVSREHARIRRKAGVWFVEDLASKNGTFCNGNRIDSVTLGDAPRVLRVGSTLMLLLDDLSAGIEQGDLVLGSRMRHLQDRVRNLTHQGTSLLVVGETGTGKEIVARWFHQLGPAARGPFVPVNCAAIPRDLTERLFFGAARGAYSGAHAESNGYVQAADGGTLFLDEIGEMDLISQAKLLRVLETHEVTRLGEQRVSKVDLRVVAATNQDLQRRIQDGQFRADLYYRLAQPHVQVPPLRDRLEEIPALIALAAPSLLQANFPSFQGVRFLERCLLLPWPGNVRELLAASREAARQVQTRAAAASLDEILAPPAKPPPEDNDAQDGPLDREQVEAALRACGGNTSQAAKTLSVHRSKLRRFLLREKIPTKEDLGHPAGRFERQAPGPALVRLVQPGVPLR